MALSPGTRLGSYEILGAIGAGGMGEVYRAKDTRLRREVAIKVLPVAVANDADRLRRFEQEALATAALNHPNILTVYDVGKDAETAYVVLELLEGQTLREATSVGLLPVRKAIEFAVQIANGLAAAHAKGIVHRDLKPENLFVTTDERIKILDFGLARIADAPASGTMSTALGVVTEPGMVMGTLGYMSPEQVRGLAVDHRSDIFSFGAVLYELLSGRRAFTGDTSADTMTAILREAPPELSESGRVIPPALERVVQRCLEKNPAVRFQSASDLAFALNLDSSSGSTTGGAAIPAAGALATSTGLPVVRGRRALVLAAIGGALAIGAVAGVLGRDRLAPGAARITEVSYQPVTFDTGFVFAARFAKDERTVVYSADWDGRARDLYVTSLDSRESRPLGLTGSDLLGLTMSGDLAILSGSQIARGGNAYMRQGLLSRSSLTGGATRPVQEDVRFADIAADGEMAVVRQSANEWLLEFPVGHVLARAPNRRLFSASGFVTPRVSPDGRNVAVMAAIDGGGWRLQVFRRGAGLVIESEFSLTDWWGLAWRSADEIWFGGTETSGRQTSVLAFSLAGRARRVYLSPGALTLHDVSAGGDVLATFDLGADRLELARNDGDSRDRTWQDGSWMVDMSDTGVVLANQFGDSGGPDGAVLAWPSDAPQPVRISDGVGIAISPDGSTALVRRGPQALSLVPVGTGPSRTLDIGSIRSVGWVGWHPDGRLIMEVLHPDRSHGIIAVSPSGAAPVSVLPSDLQLLGGRLLSPDGTRIVATDREGALRLCVLAAGTCTALPGSRPGDDMCGWSADSRSVFVRQGRDASAQLESLDLTSGRRDLWRVVKPRQPALSGIRRIIVAPNGDALFNYSWASTKLYVIRGLR